MWRRFISSIGFDNVTVNTLLDRKQYKPGESIVGKIEMIGGTVDRNIEGIVITLVLKYEQDKDDSDFSYHEKEINEVILTELLSLHSKETTTIPFSIAIPHDHLSTTKGVETVLRTKLQVAQNVDPHDEDTILIL